MKTKPTLMIILSIVMIINIGLVTAEVQSDPIIQEPPTFAANKLATYIWNAMWTCALIILGCIIFVYILRGIAFLIYGY